MRNLLLPGLLVATAITLVACSSDGEDEATSVPPGADSAYDEANEELLDTLPIPPNVEELSRSARRSPVSQGRIFVAVYGASEDAGAADILSSYQKALEEVGWVAAQDETRTEFSRGAARVIVDVSSLEEIGQYAVAVDHAFRSEEDSP